jgi:hypothetical protein
MQILGFSLQRLAGLQAAAASESKTIKKYHWSSLLRIGLLALFSNTTSALAMMSTAPPPPPSPSTPIILKLNATAFCFQLPAELRQKRGLQPLYSSAMLLARRIMGERACSLSFALIYVYFRVFVLFVVNICHQIVRVG